jgi:4'-phosphopantetheinyl transferase
VKNHTTPTIWSTEPCPFQVADKRIDIWQIDLKDAKLHHLEYLSEDELIRAQKLIHQTDKDRFIRSRCSLRFILAQSLQVAPASLVFEYGEKGKPKLSVPSNSMLEFNLSHGTDKALIALSRGYQLGIDISDINRSTNNIGISKRSFSDTEHQSLLNHSRSDVPQEFHRIWSKKEAYTKAIGRGYAYGFRNFTVSSEFGLIDDILNKDACDQWTIFPINTGSDTAAALAHSKADQQDIPNIYYWNLETDEM